MARENERIAIADLYPFETSGASGKVARHTHTIKKGGDLEAIKVLEVDGANMVVDGTNRVLAAKRAGWTEIAVIYAYCHEQELGRYRDALKIARQENRRGFENVPVGGVGERADSYQATQPSTIDEFLKRIDPGSDNANPCGPK